MRREDKLKIIDNLTEDINKSAHFYITDISELNAGDTSDLRRTCFKKDIKLIVVKNTLLKKALESSDKNVDEVYDILKNSTSIMFSETGNLPAKLIKEFRAEHERPVLKAAYVEESVYIGDEQLDTLVNIKSKDELVADIIALLQSPMNIVISSLKSGANILHGVLETLSNKES